MISQHHAFILFLGVVCLLAFLWLLALATRVRKGRG